MSSAVSLRMLVSSLLSGWGACQLLALVVGAVWWRRRRGEWRPWALGAVGAALGAVALGALIRAPRMLLDGRHDGFEVMAIGALAGLSAGVAIGARRGGRRAALELDRAAGAMGAMVAVARLGCFHAGCDFGTITDVPWAVRFAASAPAWHQHVRLGAVPPSALWSAPVHPTQLYEALLGVAMMALALVGRRRPGAAFASVAACYALGRWLIEWFRADEVRGILLGMSTPQWLALAILGAIVSWWTTVNEVSHAS
jgi:phosphatidylglycerol---prolipoprotein diacylglyceryl transferase